MTPIDPTILAALARVEAHDREATHPMMAPTDDRLLLARAIRDLRAQVAALTVERDEAKMTAANVQALVVNTAKGERACQFCGKAQREVRKLVAGSGGHICDECVKLCNDIIADPDRSIQAERDAAIKERDEARAGMQKWIDKAIAAEDERDAALARAELAEKQAVASSTMCDEWQDRFLEAWARAIQAEAKLAALMPLVPLLDAMAREACLGNGTGGWTEYHRPPESEAVLKAWDDARISLAALDKEATP